MRIPARLKRALLLGPLLLISGCDRQVQVADDGAKTNAVAVPSEPTGARLPRPSPDLVRDEAELIRLEREYARALVRKDRDFLMRFYASDWRGGNWRGFWSKATML